MKAFSIQNALAILVTAGFFAVIGAWMYWPPSTDNATALATLNQLTGALTIAFGGIMGYFFGSSRQSAAKDETITQMASTAASSAASSAATAAAVSNVKNGTTHTPPTSP